MKITGAEFKDWHDNGFPAGYYFEDCDTDFEDAKGNWLLDIDKTYNPDDFGYLRPDESCDENGDEIPELSISGCIKKWQKELKTAIVVLQIPKTILDEFLKSLKKEIKVIK